MFLCQITSNTTLSVTNCIKSIAIARESVVSWLVNYFLHFQISFTSVYESHEKTKFKSVFKSDAKTKNEIHFRFPKWYEKTKSQIQIRFSKVRRKWKKERTKNENQIRFSMSRVDEKRKMEWKSNSVLQCRRKPKNENEIWIPSSIAIEKRLTLRYTHSLRQQHNWWDSLGRFRYAFLHQIVVFFCSAKSSDIKNCFLSSATSELNATEGTRKY